MMKVYRLGKIKYSSSGSKKVSLLLDLLQKGTRKKYFMFDKVNGEISQ